MTRKISTQKARPSLLWHLAVLPVLLLSQACGGGESGPVHDVIMLGGTLVDGSGSAPAAGAVAITGDRISYVGPEAPAATDTIDAAGLVVAPGFIDVHSHTPPALAEPANRWNEGVLRQGVTTVVGGPDGGFAPAHIASLTEAYESQGVGTNVAFYVGHNAIRASVMGDDQQRAPSADELEAMKAMVREGMEMGAVGFSTGLMYEPGMFSETDEVIALAAEAAAYGGIYDSHVRNPVHAFLESDQEVVTIAESAGMPGKIGHLKAVGLHNEGVIRDIIGLVESARSRGVDIVSDQYPYDGAATASLTGIVVLPPDLEMPAFRAQQRQGRTEEGMAELRAALSDPATRARIAEASENGVDGGFAWLKATGYTSMRITSSPDYPELVGVYLSEIAEARGQAPFDAVADLIVGSTAPVNLTLGAIKEHDVRNLMIQPWNMIASDGAYADGSDSPLGHPRSAGTFARLMGHYVRDEGVLSLEEAVRKVTSLPADFHGWRDRGRVAVDAFADLVVFDPETIIDNSDWDHPNRFATGVVHVFVNGIAALRDGQLTQEAPGKVVPRQ